MLIEKGLPLKQGLKLGLFASWKVFFVIEKGLPLKQGLKLRTFNHFKSFLSRIEKGLPLKQGLKPGLTDKTILGINKLKRDFH
mgnify:CR=1 FL=1